MQSSFLFFCDVLWVFWSCLTCCCASSTPAARAREAQALLPTYTEQQLSSQSRSGSSQPPRVS